MKSIICVGINGSLGFRDLVNFAPKVDSVIADEAKSSGFHVGPFSDGIASITYSVENVVSGKILGIRGSMIPANRNAAKMWLRAGYDPASTFFLLVGRSTGGMNTISLCNDPDIQPILLNSAGYKIITIDVNHGPRLENHNQDYQSIYGLKCTNFYQTGKLGGYLVQSPTGENIKIDSVNHMNISKSNTVRSHIKNTLRNFVMKALQ